MKCLTDILEGLLDSDFDVSTKDINPIVRLLNSMVDYDGEHLCKFDPKPFDELWQMKDSQVAAEGMGGRIDRKAYEFFHKPQARKHWRDEIIMVFYKFNGADSIALMAPRGYITFNRRGCWGFPQPGLADGAADSIAEKCKFEGIWVFSLKSGDRTGFLDTKYKHLLRK